MEHQPISFNCEIYNLLYHRFVDAHQGHCITGEVYEGYIEENRVLFKSKNTDSETERKEDGRCLFTFSFCWRGVWEGRVYFKDDEYWGAELSQMSRLWSMIVDHSKMSIKAKYPGSYYHD